MSEQQRREGPELEPLLASLYAEHGADMRIVSAEKRRAGGLLGFFARQTFAVVIETSGSVPAPVDRPAAPETAQETALDVDTSGLLLTRVQEVNHQETPVRVGGPTFADVLAELMSAEDYQPLTAQPTDTADAVPVTGRGPLGRGATPDNVEETLTALRPDRVVAVVDATRKDEDVRACLDGRPATPARWAALGEGPAEEEPPAPDQLGVRGRRRLALAAPHGAA